MIILEKNMKKKMYVFLLAVLSLDLLTACNDFKTEKSCRISYMIENEVVYYEDVKTGDLFTTYEYTVASLNI